MCEINLPTPALSGSGSLGMISALLFKAPHCENYQCKGNRKKMNISKKQIANST